MRTYTTEYPRERQIDERHAHSTATQTNIENHDVADMKRSDEMISGGQARQYEGDRVWG